MNVTIFERSPGVFRIRIETQESGQRKFRTETLKGTRLDADARKVEILQQHQTGDLVQITDDSVEMHWSKWQANRLALKQISEVTEQSQKNLMKPFFAMYGTRPLRSLTKEDIETFYLSRIRAVAEGTMTITHHHLKAMFNQAIEAGVLAKNPMKRVSAPKGSSESRKPLEKRHIKDLLAHAADKPFLGRMIRLALHTGMRRGEMCALKWSDIDLEAGIIHVSRTVVRVGSAEYEKKPKTAKSIRSIRMPRSLIDELRAAAGRPDKHVLQTVWGDRPTLSYMTSATKDALRAIGLDEGYCLHSTRHAHATHLLREKMPLKAVSERLGHANVEVTLTVYAGVLTGDDQALADSIDKVVNG
jgi:integrase